jgi:hypothetical protein
VGEEIDSSVSKATVLPLAIAALAGLLICLAISAITGKREAFDASLYFYAGIPLMCLVIFILGYHFPERPWRWTLAMAAGQALAIAIGGSSLSLWPLAIVAMAVLSIPQFLAGMIGSRLARKGI